MKLTTLLFTTALLAALSTASFAFEPRDDEHHHGMHCGGEHGMWHHLPSASRTLLKGAMEKAHETNKPLHQQAEALHDELKALLTASTFDKDAFLDKKAKLGALHTQMQANMDKELAGALGKMNQADRQTFAKNHEKMMHHFMHEDHEHHHEHHEHEHAEKGMPSHAEDAAPDADAGKK